MQEPLDPYEINMGYYFWGAVGGWFLGMMFIKIYQLWAVWFRVEGASAAGIYGWYSSTPPLWVLALDYPLIFHWVGMVVFILAGLLFANFLIKIQRLSVK